MDLVSILQWNTKSIRRRKHELLHLVNKFHPSVIAISETWLVPGSRFRVSGYSCLRDDRADGYAGSALLVRRSLPFSQIPLPLVSPDFNIVAIKVFNISFLSVYIPHPHPSLIRDIQSIISLVPSPIILLGDFNAHHSSWGSSHDDAFGLALLEVFDEANLCILNNGSPTRRVYPSQNPRSALDLSICSSSLASIMSWRVMPLSYGSDHFPIVLTMANRPSPSLNFCPALKYRLSDVNWFSFSSALEAKIETLPECNSCNLSECYSKFVDFIVSSADEHFPLKKPFHFKVSTPWWDAECTAAVNERNRSEVAYNISMTSENFLEYKKSFAKAARLLAEKKKKDGFDIVNFYLLDSLLLLCGNKSGDTEDHAVLITFLFMILHHGLRAFQTKCPPPLFQM